jgi:hypothetical protein
MPKPPALLSGAFRLVAAFLGVAAVTMLGGAGYGPGEAGLDTSDRGSQVATPVRDGWLLRANGWFVSVDRGHVEPSTAAPPAPAAPRKPSYEPLSPFDDIIQRHARKEGFDWRLIAAVISQESGFDPRSRSVRGAYGLMQVREIAARAVGEKSFKSPEDNVRTGVRYLQHVRKIFWKSPPQDRRKLMLAAYHMGPSHVRDAQKLARRRGYDPHLWSGSMEIVLPLLENPRVYTKLAHGYARGRLTVAYVNRVLEQFHAYRLHTDGAPAADSAQTQAGDAAVAG